MESWMVNHNQSLIAKHTLGRPDERGPKDHNNKNNNMHIRPVVHFNDILRPIK